MLDSDTKRRIDTCRDILVGKVPDPKSQVEQITIALIYKFMDDMDAEAEELGGKRNFFTGEFARYGWSKMMTPGLGGHEMLSLYAEAIQRMNENPAIPPLFRDIFKNAFLPYRDPETLRSFLKEIDTFTYDHSERLGDAFEYLLSVLGSQGEAGQFRTPRHIIDFMVEITDPKKDETILDPACGTAGFLISSYKHILKHNSTGYQEQEDREAYDEKGVPIEELPIDNPLHYSGDRLTPDDRKRLATNISGYDISPDMVRLSLVNMYLHGFIDPHIEEYDTLTSDEKWSELADVILANPPFMSPKGGIRPHNRFAVQSKRSEVLFVDYMAEHLTPNGRAAIVVPEGIIFQSQSAYKQLREMLVKGYLVAVISLPAGVFNPYSGVKTSILVLDKRLAKQRDDVLFVKIENDGFNLGAQRRPIDKNDLPEAVRTVKAFLHQGEVAERKNVLAVSRERIGENGEWKLSAERYVEATSVISTFEFVPMGQAASRVKQSINPSDHSGSVNYIGLENIESETGRLVGEVHSDYSGIKSTKTVFQAGDVLYGKLRPNLNKVHLASFEGICSTDIYSYRADNCIPEFLTYVMRSAQFNAEVLKGLCGAQLPRVNAGYLEQIDIPLPPLEVQKEIVAEIEGYQKIIDGSRQVVENYQPRIPIHPDWPMVELGEVCSVRSGGTPSRKNDDYWNGDIPWVGSAVCKDTKVNRAEEFITQVGLENSAAKIFKKGTTLIALVGATIGKTGFLEFDCSTNQNIAGLYPFNEEELLPAFLYYSAQTLYPEFMRLGEGKFRMANLSFVKSLKIRKPDLDTQISIVEEIETEQSLVDANKELIHRFEEKIKQTISRVWGDAE